MDAHDPVRRSYDTVAEKYAAGFGDELSHKPLDRALLACLAEQARGPVADLGCGPGHVAAWLTGLGMTAVGVDLSPVMAAVGRREHPEVEFRVGDLLDLPAEDGEFGAAVAFYSVIHLEAGELRRAFGEMHRVLRPGGLVLVSFHLGTEVRRLTEFLGHGVAVDFHFFEQPDVVAAMEDAGFAVDMRLERAHYPQEVATRRGYLLGRRLV
jgi:SAM-dependent methyltransferase